MNHLYQKRLYIILTCLWFGLLFVLYQFYSHQRLIDLAHSEEITLELIVNSLQSEIQRYQAIGNVLASNTTVLDSLKSPENTKINQYLERINQTTGSLDTYLMNQEGMTIAASNWQKPDNFVGKDFSYRPYFQQAMSGRSGYFFAIGTSTNLRGFYIATPVESGGHVIGAVVIKIAVEHLERLWKSDDRELSLVGRDGIIFISTRPDWRLRSLQPLTSSERLTISSTRKYPDADGIELLDVQTQDYDADGFKVMLIKTPHNEKMNEYLVLSFQMEEAQWSVLLTSRTQTANNTALIEALATGLGLLSLLVIGYFIYARYSQTQKLLETEQDYRNQLESDIKSRQQDLQVANQELLHTQEQLVQSGRLAAIGRFSAGLSHEINQPLTAIHSYVSNAQQLIKLDRTDDAQQKLEQIANLTDRIARIIKQLKVFMRGDELSTMPVSLKMVITQALSIMQECADLYKISVVVELSDDDVFIAGNETLIQQLFVNLISNALDAASKVSDPSVKIIVMVIDGKAVVTVSDNGVGVSEKDLPNIFEPFYSTKNMNRGLGLGLTISQEIVNRFNGELSVINNPDAGATFTVSFVL